MFFVWHPVSLYIYLFLHQSTFDGKPRQRYLELLGYKVGDLKDMVSNMTDSVGELTDSVGEMTLDSDTALINKSDADSSGSDKVLYCLYVCCLCGCTLCVCKFVWVSVNYRVRQLSLYYNIWWLDVWFATSINLNITRSLNISKFKLPFKN